MSIATPGRLERVFSGLFFRAMVLLTFYVAPAVAFGSEVLIYCANETAPEGREQENYDTIIAWLRHDGRPQSLKIAESLETDRRVFAAAVDVEVNDLTAGAPAGSALAGLVVVTNRLLRQNRCLVWQSGQDEIQSTSLKVEPGHENFILAANPLARSEVLASVLAFAADRFDPERHEFVLVVKSHGSGTKVVTPRLAVRAEETSREELLRIANDELPEAELPPWTDRLGITKQSFLRVLGQAGEQQGIVFSLVFLEACNAPQHEFAPGELPPNVRRLLLIRDNANYINLLYADVLQQEDTSRPFSAALLASTGAKFQLVPPRDESEAPGGLPLYIYFLPLALWLAWVAWRWKKRRRADRNESSSPPSV
ncbi:MAG: hypothetical protein RIC55_14190 [Pirellulaceae bacterium]